VTKAQEKKLRAKLQRIATLASESLDVIGDDPMAGELWSALNRINSDANDALNEHVAQAVGNV
jgi:hypothetical protein